MPSFDEVDRLEEQLYSDRQTLALYLYQEAMHGQAYVPIYIINKRQLIQKEIERIKSILRSWDFVIEDLPERQIQPSQADINRHLRWLKTKRAQFKFLFNNSAKEPDSASIEIYNLRLEIWRLKMTLRDWGIIIEDQLHEYDLVDAHDVEQQQKLLAAYYRSLADNLQEEAIYGHAFVPFDIIKDINIARKEIRYIKTRLRKSGIEIYDQFDDDYHSTPIELIWIPSAAAILSLSGSIALSPQRPLRVFLCHSSKDKLTVRNLCNQLWADGFQPWLDEKDILPGQDWDEAITRAVWASDIVLVCLSRTALTKAGYVQKEIRIALDVADRQPESTVFVIPVKLEECTVPDRLTRWQWVNLFEEHGYERLAQALRARALTIL